jgi:hypothetical protein
MDDENWFPRFAEIPEIEYAAPKGLDFSHLAVMKITPEISYYNFDGKRRKSIMWNYGNTSSSAAPAHGWTATQRQGESQPLFLLRQVYETLELPGKLSDYHFALQRTHDELNGFIGKESWVASAIENLCKLNIQLLEKHPETISYENENGIHYARVTAFNRLIRLYETEGYLRDALEIAKIALKFDYGYEKVEEIEDKIKLLESEDSYDKSTDL